MPDQGDGARAETADRDLRETATEHAGRWPRARAVPAATDVSREVPVGIRVAAAFSWRLLLIVAAAAAVSWIVGQLAVITIPIGIALLLSALLAPLVSRLRRVMPLALATAVAVVAGLCALGGVLTLVITQFAAGVPQLRVQVGSSVQAISSWLQHGPLHLNEAQLHQALTNAAAAITGSSGGVTAQALTTASAVGEVLSAAALTLFTLIFFLYSGTPIWRFLLRLVPAPVRARVDVAGRRAFASLVSYERATVAVALVDAACIGTALWILGVPLAAPLSALIFLGAFIPIVGAVLTGAVAVLVALVAKGFLAAVVVLAVVTAVMQLEGHVLQPLLLGRATRLHPLAVVLGVATGFVVAGVIGALLAVPITAVLKTAISSLRYDPDLPQNTVDALDTAQARTYREQAARNRLRP